MLDPTARQLELLGELQQRDPELVSRYDPGRGVYAMVRGALTRPRKEGAEDEDALQKFLDRYGELFGPPTISRTTRLLRNRRDNLGWRHLELQQYTAPTTAEGRPSRSRTPANGDGEAGRLEVYASKLVAHFNADGALVEIQSSCWRDIPSLPKAKIGPKQVQELLAANARRSPGYDELARQMRERKEEQFPVMQPPRQVAYPWQGELRVAWTTYAYGPAPKPELRASKEPVVVLDLGQTFIDAMTGEQFLFAPTSKGVETADTGLGLGVTPIGGPYVARTLDITHVDSGTTYRLHDTTEARDIITYDAGNSSSFDTDTERLTGITGGTLPVSSDADGDKDWDQLPANTTVAERTASQQPEVDLHFHIRDIYRWYDALAGGRAGWDDGQYSDPPVPDQAVRAIAHASDGGNAQSINAGERLQLSGGNWVSWLQFFDGDVVTYDYLSGSRFIVGHEYQHGITDFNFVDGSGNPGLTYSDWLAACHEGLSDVFGGLFSEDWSPGTDISPTGQVFRNIAYPRDTAAFDPSKFDHFADRNNITGTGARYFRGDILAHVAFLIGAGGVHQRLTRTPALIPVVSLGRETVNGRDVLKAARIWYRAVTYYFSNHGALTGIPANDENTFHTLRDGCVSAAADLYGTNSPEHRGTILAFYAAGLHPTGTTYGPDVTFLRWGADWWRSRPYIGVPSPDWSSVDLFVNNGGASEWNALINVMDGGTPTDFENSVYCRVRNVGDQQAPNVQLQFEYARVGTGGGAWLPVTDKDGNIQTLSVGTLAAGASNFPDSAQNSPPITARIKWYIPPLAMGETADHYCLRATAVSLGDVNPHNNQVQSNIAYAPYDPGGGFRMGLVARNPFQRPIPVDLRVSSAMPKGWRARVLDILGQERLNPGEERLLTVGIDMRPGADKRIEPPYDGEIRGTLAGPVSGAFSGTLLETRMRGAQFTGRLAARVGDAGTFVGVLEGLLDADTGRIRGRAVGEYHNAGAEPARTAVSVDGCLRPLRRVDIAQFVDGHPIGGVTVQVQVPTPAGSCAFTLPPTDTLVRPRHEPRPEPGTGTGVGAGAAHAVKGKVERLFYDSFGEFRGFAIEQGAGVEGRKIVRIATDERGVERVMRRASERDQAVTVHLLGEGFDRIVEIAVERD